MTEMQEVGGAGAPQVQYKYELWNLLNNHLSATEKQAAMQDLPRLLGISTSQFKKFIYAHKGSNTQLTVHQAVAIASYMEAKTKIPLSAQDLISP